ncbi:hypothetical protein RCO28_25970 [Streptomyces sp. LHD-70]|uniref:hypothetical protein n=1 Tax=Streptomyces sp. LHD-70 TaxID=3072140 RepID=UPI00280FBE1A|nr:hypothetical protein [Streptomyces sp. LHD-70]MDQ8705914.1 hypothetical protein [Streptomyces sp. LHD-70]
MAHNPHAPQGPQGGNDPAGSTQMFRAFVEESAPQQQQSTRGGSRVGLIVGIVAAVVIVAAVAWLALS